MRKREGQSSEHITDKNGDIRPKFYVDSLPSTSRFRSVHDIVMDKGRGMQELHCDPDIECIQIPPPRSGTGEHRNNGTDPFPSSGAVLKSRTEIG